MTPELQSQWTRLTFPGLILVLLRIKVRRLGGRHRGGCLQHLPPAIRERGGRGFRLLHLRHLEDLLALLLALLLQLRSQILVGSRRAPVRDTK